MNPTVIKFNPADPNLKSIRDLAQYARLGRIIAFPTETVYGIGVPASHQKGIEKLYHVKGREASKPLAYHIGDWDQLPFLRVVRNAAFRYLSKKFWPGPVTLVAATENGQKIGIRFPKSIPTCTLISSSGEPFLASSANLSGRPSPKTAEEVLQNLDGKIDFVIDAGPCPIGVDSTVVDVTGAPAVLREGAEIHAVREAIDDIEAGRIPRKKILLVCTGNSCRTPIAWGLLMSELRRKRLDREIELASCGILARDGGTATTEAIFVMKNREIDISSHRTRSCRREDIMDADLVLAMSEDHYDFLVNLVPGISQKIKVLDIADPIGQGLSVYEEAVKQIEEKIRKEWDEIVK